MRKLEKSIVSMLFLKHLKISCTLRQLNDECIETALDSNVIGLHFPRTATAERESRDTRRVV